MHAQTIRALDNRVRISDRRNRPAVSRVGGTGSTSPVTLVARALPVRIPATLRTVRTERGDHGTRQLVARLTTNEPVTVRSRLTRGKRLIGGARRRLTAGTHEVRLPVAADARGGQGKLTVVLTDQAGHKRTLTKAVTVPALA